MKPVLTLLIIALFPVLLFSQEETPQEPTAQDTEEQEPVRSDEELYAEAVSIWKQDSAKLTSMISEVLKYKKNSADSTLQAKKREKQFQAALEQMAKKNRGTKLALSAVQVKDVVPEKGLTPYGEKKVKEFIRSMKDNPYGSLLVGGSNPADNTLLQLALAFSIGLDPQCFKETGRYEVSYVIPIPAVSGSYEEYRDGAYLDETRQLKVTILIIEKSEKEALAVDKGSIYSISGIIRNVNYKESLFGDELTITID